jgi:hypothetical protein
MPRFRHLVSISSDGDTLKNELSNEELVQMITRLLRANDLSFLLDLKQEDLECLVAAVRHRVEG